MDDNLAKIRHERSKKDFPSIAFEDGEYVEFAFSRARVCFLLIWGITFTGIILVLAGFLFTLMSQDKLDEMGLRFLFIILFALLAAILISGIVTSRVYRGNKIFITNMHVIQMVMNSPVSNSINIIDLSSVEDASFRQDTIMQKIFNYGTFRLATVGDETTYTFKYSDISPKELKEVTRLITEAKNKSKKSASND